MTEPLMIEYPNGHGSGHSGSESSKDRQVREDASGLTKQRQTLALEAVTDAAHRGITSGELENLLGIGHGQASSALSHLHRAGRIKRITERRMKQELYVLAEHVGERKESPYNPRPQRKHPKFHSDRTVMEAMNVGGIPPAYYLEVRKFLEALP
jgi:ribosomal protein S25